MFIKYNNSGKDTELQPGWLMSLKFEAGIHLQRIKLCFPYRRSYTGDVAQAALVPPYYHFSSDKQLLRHDLNMVGKFKRMKRERFLQFPRYFQQHLEHKLPINSTNEH